MGLTQQQKQAARAEGSVTITAGAGTGKTYMLAERYFFHLDQQGFSPLEIVAMTYTDKAATELRSRIRQTVTAQAPDRFDWLAELEAAPICTFHSLAARICREHPEVAGVPADFTPMDEWEGQLWQAEQVAIALDQLPERLYAQVPSSVMQSAIAAFLKDPLSAEAALRRGQQDWLPILQETQENIIEALINQDFWMEAKGIISHNQGQSGDKLEIVRQTALELIEQIEHYAHNVQGNAFQTALQNWLDFKVGNIGSKKNWQSEDILKQVRRALIDWRDFTRDFPDIALLSIQVGELDFKVGEMIPSLTEAFTLVRSQLTEAKRKQRILDFNDLEVHALKALEKPDVQDYYHQRWKAFLIDEFQDTNPTQGKLLEALTQQKVLTLVGDEKQSIYGFRRAEIEVFKTWRDRLGHTLPLTTSFRTHSPLIENINQIFAPILKDLHQALDAERSEPPHPAPHVESFIIVPDPQSKPEPNTEQLRQAEAQHIADLIQTMLQEKRLIWDKKTKEHRPIQPGDIAILARKWAPLEFYGQAIGDRQVEGKPIPVLQAGGGNLLDTREAKDGWALLRFLADARDDIALVALLRSPFFALSDRLLFTLRQAVPEDLTWWQLLQASENEQVVKAVAILKQLRNYRQIDPPSRLLQKADRLTGYTAVIANLPNHQRRLADWQGFLDTVRRLEAGTAEVFIVVRRLKRLINSKIEIKRPPLEAGNAITLMTIHGAKGLEWSVVIVPDLSRKTQGDHPVVLFDPKLGMALKLDDEAGEKEKSALYLLLEQRQKQRDKDEMKRLLYVATTRARDRLIFTTGQGDRGLNLWQLLQVGLQGEFSPQEVLFNPETLTGFNPIDPPLPTIPPQVLVKPVFGGVQLPITALTDYARCPKHFEYEYIKGHPHSEERTGTGNYGREIGILTHTALAKGITTAIALQKYNQALPPDKVQDALDLAESFRTLPIYSSVREGHWEQFLSFRFGSIRLNGSADLIGDDFILDIKTDQEIDPQEHRFQIWAYAKAAKKSQAYIAYLRHKQLVPFSKEDLQTISQEAEELIMAIKNKNFMPMPSQKVCPYCPYGDICDQVFASATTEKTDE